jgi:tetratricopeptide (TPR) repeat protein
LACSAFASNTALGDPASDALESFRDVAKKLKKIDPKSAEANVAASFVLSAEGRGLEAWAIAEQAIKLPAYSPEGRGIAHWLYGCYLLKSGETDPALREFRVAERELTDAPTPLTEGSLGLAYFLKGDYEQALTHLKESTQREPRHAPGHFWTGRVLEEQGAFLKAIDEFQAADLVQEGDLASVEAFYDDLRNAVQQGPINGYWRKRLEIEWNQSRTNAYEVARVYLHLGDKARAYEWLSRFSVGDSYGLLIDPCWDQQNEHYLAFARKLGLKP